MRKIMSKTLLILMVGMLILSPLALNGAQKKGAKKMKSLVVYYSYTGNTEIVAKALAEELKADTLKIEDAQTPSKFKAYVSGAFAARGEKSWPIKTVNVLLKDYDRIFVGAPIWWGKAAPEINGYIEQTDFKGKSVVVFVTMGGSKADDALKALSAKIVAKGGTIVSSFSVKTGGVKKEDLPAKAKEIAVQYK